MTTSLQDGIAEDCTGPDRVTKSLLGYGVIAGPFYLIVSLAQALTRSGFDLTRHEWSLLANGSLGWIQIANLALTGLMTITFAVGLRRAIDGKWAPRLIAVFGLGMIGAAAFRADPALGFPPGTPEAGNVVSWHGILHFVCAGIGFVCAAAACFVLARQLDGRGWAGFSRLTGVLFGLGFLSVAAGAGATWANLTFTAAIVLIWGWLAALSVHLYRHV